MIPNWIVTLRCFSIVILQSKRIVYKSITPLTKASTLIYLYNHPSCNRLLFILECSGIQVFDFLVLLKDGQSHSHDYVDWTQNLLIEK